MVAGRAWRCLRSQGYWTSLCQTAWPLALSLPPHPLPKLKAHLPYLQHILPLLSLFVKICFELEYRPINHHIWPPKKHTNPIKNNESSFDPLLLILQSKTSFFGPVGKLWWDETIQDALSLLLEYTSLSVCLSHTKNPCGKRKTHIPEC